MTFNWELFNDLTGRLDERIKNLEQEQRDAYKYSSQMNQLKHHFKDSTPLDNAQNRIRDIERDLREERKHLDLLWLIRDLATTEKDPSK